jgi:primary-amine oxidase
MPGTFNFADWSVSWSIPNGWGGGLVISKARFRNEMVLYKGTAPFVLVPYHGHSPVFKDGLHHRGAPFTSILPTSANSAAGPGTPPAGNDNQWDCLTNPAGAVMVEKEPATLLEPARAVIWAKFQCYNYQYVHRWEFRADGSIEAGVGLGGRLWNNPPAADNHVHNFYFRLDFDIVASANNAVQEFGHPNLNLNTDAWTTLAHEGRRLANASHATKWRVVNRAPKPNGSLRSYEIVLGSDMAPDQISSSGDVWVLAYDPAQDGAAVGHNHPLPDDSVLHTDYLHTPGGAGVDGADVVVWCCLRHHHETRRFGEETITLPYEFLSLHIEPRDFLDGTPTKLYATTPLSP